MYHWFILIKDLCRSCRQRFLGPWGPCLKSHPVTRSRCQQVPHLASGAPVVQGRRLRDFGRFRAEKTASLLGGFSPPLWKIWTSVGSIIPKKHGKTCSKPATSSSFLQRFQGFGSGDLSFWESPEPLFGPQAQTSHRCNHTWSPGIWHGMANQLINTN